MKPKEIETLNRKYENKYFPIVKKAIRSEISSLVSVVKREGVHRGILYLNSKVSHGDLPHVIWSMTEDVGLRYAQITDRELRKEVKKGFGFNSVWAQWLKDYLYVFIVEKITFSVFETTKSVLMNILRRAIDEGLGLEETVRQLEDTELDKTQAARIVRTEITRASNAGTFAGASTFPFEQQKEWIAAHDMRTRGGPGHSNDHANHWSLDGITIDYNDHFTDPVNRDKLMFPGDPKASAASTVNCRCSMSVTAKRDHRNRLIPR